MDEQTKQIVGIGVGVGAIGVVSVLGYWYYKKAKEQAKMDEMMKEGEADISENYQSDKPFFEKLKDTLFPKDYRTLPKIYPQDNRKLPKSQQKIVDDLEEYERIHARRNRFTVYDSVQSRFKILETHGDKGVEVRGTGRFRTSGNIHRRTEGGYSRNRNNRNANFSDLSIF